MTVNQPQIQNPDSPVRFELTGESVHIWQASLIQNGRKQELYSLLAVEERQRAQRFRFEIHRERYIAGRGMLRILVGAYLNIDPALVRFCYSVHQKPMLDPFHKSELNFNLANSDDRVVYLFSLKRRSGIDLEYVHPMLDEDHFGKLYFSERESRNLGALRDIEKTSYFFRLWTCKEAFLKAIGKGLTGELSEVEVDFLPDGTARFLSLPGEAAQDWQLMLFSPWENFQSALAIEGDSAKINFLDMEQMFASRGI